MAADPRHNPDLDAAMGFGSPPPSAKPPGPLGASAGDLDAVVGELDTAVHDLVGATDDLDEVIGAVRKVLTGNPAFAASQGADGPHQPTAIARTPGATSRGDELPELVRLVGKIHDLMLHQYKEAAAAGRDQRRAEDVWQGPGIGDALRPVTDRLANTRVGRIVGNAYRRVRPHVQPHIDRAKRAAGDRLKRWAGDKLADRLTSRLGKSGKAPGPGGAPKGGAAGGRAAAAEAGAGRAAAGAGARAAGGAAAAEGGAAAGAAGGGAGAAGAAGAVALPVAAVAALTYGIYEAGKALHDFAYEQEQVNRKWQGISPTQSAIWNERDALKTFREIDKGESAAGSSAALARTLDKLEAKLAPLESALTSLANVAAAGGVEALVSFVELAKPLIVVIEEAAKKYAGYDPNPAGGSLAFDHMRQIAKELDERDRRAKDAIEATRRAAERR